ncbi:hypothetical protein [Yinghuangia soli]|uniref:Uncharacterized protein n=1 Tax=Yinghuangia soli TaxID=2908204 RepID=A0AA41Q504_9ACTN|nr:hypothetical protein [Yinghuangia soli]MCF2530781.1 hypothetical protein [Yinghuangia soli]
MKSADVPDRQAVTQAAAVLSAQLGLQDAHDRPPSATFVWQGYLRYAGSRFATPPTPDADGLLFQFGTWAFDGPRMFSVDFCRQFEIVGEDGEFEHYVQVHCELIYPADPELDALGGFNSWFFHDSGDDLEAWAAAIGSHQVWSALDTRRPSSLRVWEDDAC